MQDCEFFSICKQGYSLGFYDAGDKIVQWLNSLDTSEMTVKDFRNALYHYVIEMRPNNNDCRRYFTEEED